MQSGMPWSGNEFLVYRNPEFGFVMEYPAAWQTQEQVTPSSFTATVSAPAEPASQFRESIVFNIQALFAPTPLADILQVNLQQLQQAGYVVEPPESVLFGGNPAYQYVFSCQVSPLPLPGKALCSITTKGARSYGLVYLARAEKYSQYLEIVSRMIQSVRLA
jgi:hypothetical protein